MKNKTILTAIITGCLLAVFFTACKKSSNETASGVTNATDAANSMNITSNAADMAKNAGAQAVTAATNAASSATAQAADQAVAGTNVVNSATTQFADGVANAKKLIADKNYQGALDQLKQLSSTQLSADQQAVVDDLKTQVTKLLSGGGLFGK